MFIFKTVVRAEYNKHIFKIQEIHFDQLVSYVYA